MSSGRSEICNDGVYVDNVCVWKNPTPGVFYGSITQTDEEVWIDGKCVWSKSKKSQDLEKSPADFWKRLKIDQCYEIDDKGMRLFVFLVILPAIFLFLGLSVDRIFGLNLDKKLIVVPAVVIPRLGLSYYDYVRPPVESPDVPKPVIKID
jgi:hypothetical protein